MKMTIVIIVAMLLASKVVAGKVYMCVDPVTGESSFTDKACETRSVGEEVRVQTTNPGSGHRYTKKGAKKTWSSQRDTRKTGLDYSAQKSGTTAN
jgi:hypothetical protein